MSKTQNFNSVSILIVMIILVGRGFKNTGKSRSIENNQNI